MTLAEEMSPFAGEDDLEAFYEFAMQSGWGDGLPLIPPTKERVERMLAGAGLPGSGEVGTVPPHHGIATFERIAANAVMAGCTPELFGIVCAAVEAMLDDSFNLYGIQATTSPASPVVIVNGPIRHEVGLHAGQGAFGPGWRANATLGRAIRLIMWNIGGGRPYVLGESLGVPAFDMSTQGFPGKYSFCAAENEEESPWDPIHVERGFRESTSAVTVIAADSSHDFRDVASISGRDTLICIARTMSMWGTANMLYGAEPGLVLSPEQAIKLANEGWSKDDIREFLFQEARLDMRQLPEETQEYVRIRRPDSLDLSSLPVCNAPEDIVLAVIGGPGIHGVFLSTFSGGRSVTTEIP